MALCIQDTLSGKKKPLRKSKKAVKMFVCGPTVYGPAHIGHARVEAIFDSFARHVRDSGYALTYVQNITDVDDKIIDAAREAGIAPQALARRYEKEYLADMKALRIVSVDRRARASDFIDEIQGQIARLMKKGFAYRTSSGVYFEVRKFKPYGALSKQDLDALRPGWRIEPDAEKKDHLDFSLWKNSVALDEVGWPSPWGRGRPGWHIEDTAITEKLLGQQYDIHGGGNDLKFPHHESEIAQQEAASGKTPFVLAWMHVGFLSIGGAKMSKSLHNSIEISEFLEKHSVNAIRLMFMSAHYRSPISYTERLMEQASSAISSIQGALARLDLVALRGTASELSPRKIVSWLLPHERAFKDAMDDDFNTPAALAALFSFIGSCEAHMWQMSRSEVHAARHFLVKRLALFGIAAKNPPIPVLIRGIAKRREKLRAEKDFAGADRVRREIEIAGYSLLDTPLGPLIFPNAA